MSINEYLLVSAAILIIIDFLFPIYLHFFAYGIISYVVITSIDMPIIYQVFFGILSYFILVIFHFVLWKKVIEKFIDTFIAPQKLTGGSEGLIGQFGLIKEVNGKLLFSIHEELHEFKSDFPVAVGKKYVVKDVVSATLTLGMEQS
jgi:membrane protein implicated in regulation of membrane protease activity